MSHTPPTLTLIDVRAGSDTAHLLRDELIAGLKAPTNHKSVPTILLYDEAGLRIYDRITTDAEEYYLFACEEEILRTMSSEIVQSMRATPQQTPRAAVVEFGAGYA